VQSAEKLTFRDPNVQLRALYMDLLRNQSHFDEFKHLLALYHPDGVSVDGTETASAREVRERLNDRIQCWLATPIDTLSPAQVLQWRTIVVEERFGSAHTQTRSGFGVY
jgi:hypothetical protein